MTKRSKSGSETFEKIEVKRQELVYFEEPSKPVGVDRRCRLRVPKLEVQSRNEVFSD